MLNPMGESQMKMVVEGRRRIVYEGLITDSAITAGTLWDTYEIRLEEAQAFHLYITSSSRRSLSQVFSSALVSKLPA